MSSLDTTIRELESACRELLAAHPDGITEHALLQTLREPPHRLLPTLALDDSLGLFQSHFLLFHVLYRLGDQLRQEQQAQLSISPLQIRLQPYVPGEEGLASADPLRDYYLNLDELEHTGTEEVEAMLGGFWGRFEAGGDKQEALAVLELQEPVTLAEVKAQYRRLVMQHHPDRGGDATAMHKLNNAMSILQRCLD